MNAITVARKPTHSDGRYVHESRNLFKERNQVKSERMKSRKENLPSVGCMTIHPIANEPTAQLARFCARYNPLETCILKSTSCSALGLAVSRDVGCVILSH